MAMASAVLHRYLLPTLLAVQLPIQITGIESCPGEGRFAPSHSCAADGVFKICAKLLASPQTSALQKWGAKDYFAWMQQPDPSAAVKMMQLQHGDHACVSTLTFASVVKLAGCENVHFMCSASDTQSVLSQYEQQGSSDAAQCVKNHCADGNSNVAAAALQSPGLAATAGATAAPATTLDPFKKAQQMATQFQRTGSLDPTPTPTPAPTPPPAAPPAQGGLPSIMGAQQVDARSVTERKSNSNAISSTLPPTQPPTPGLSGNVPPTLLRKEAQTTPLPKVPEYAAHQASRPPIFTVLTNLVLFLAVLICCGGVAAMLYQHHNNTKGLRGGRTNEYMKPPSRQTDSHYSQHGGGWGAYGPPGQERGSFNGQERGSFNGQGGSFSGAGAQRGSFPGQYPGPASFPVQSGSFSGAGYDRQRDDYRGGGYNEYGPPPTADAYNHKPKGEFRHDAYRNPNPENRSLLR